MHGHVPTAQDLRLLVTVARCGLQTDDVPLLAGILEDHKSIVDPAGLSQMFRDLVSTCIEGGEVRIAYETFSRMLAAGVARDDAVDKLELQIQRAEDLQASQ